MWLAMWPAGRDACCNMAMEGTQCKHKCEDIFDSRLPTESLVLDVEVHCSDPRIVQCAANYTNMVVPRSNPRDSEYYWKISSEFLFRQKILEIAEKKLSPFWFTIDTPTAV